jgi:hypothetical protein
MNNVLFSLDRKKDSKSIGKLFTLVKMEVDDQGKDTGNNLRAKLTEIDQEGYYTFAITAASSELAEFKTKTPNDGDVEK